MTEEPERKRSSLSKKVITSALFFKNVEAEHACFIWHGTHHLQSNNENASSYMIAPHTYIRISKNHNSLSCETIQSLSVCEEGNNIAI